MIRHDSFKLNMLCLARLSAALTLISISFAANAYAQYTFTLPLVNNSGTVGSEALIQGTDTSTTANEYNLPAPAIGTCPASFSDVPVGMMVLFTPHAANTTIMNCLDICGFGHTGGSCPTGSGDPVGKYGDAGLAIPDLVTFNQAFLIWDGAHWQL